MDVKEFAEIMKQKVAERLESQLKPENQVTIQQVTRNNNTVYYGLLIPQKKMAPIFYIDQFYEEYCNGKDLDDLVSLLISKIEETEQNKPDIDTSTISDFEKAKQYITYKLVNRECNQELLEQMVWEPWLDLAKVFILVIDHPNFPKGTMVIRKSHCNHWGVSEETIKELGNNNMKNNGLSEIHRIDYFLKCDPDILPDMWVLTNRENYLGAAGICCTDKLSEFSDSMQSDIIILPSSTHEVFMIPYNDTEEIKELKHMVYEANHMSGKVAQEDYLSDSLYIYRRQSNAIEILE